MKNIGQIIVNQRKKLNITQAELADKLGISKSFMCKIENGKTPINLKWLAKIGEVLQIDMFDNLNDVNESLKKWQPIIDVFEEKGITPEEISSLINKFISN